MASKLPTLTIEDLVHKVNISKGCLDRECSSQDLQHVAKHCVKWKLIGHQLGLHSLLSDIDSDHTREEDKRITMLTTWQQAFSFKATFRVLIEALIACNDADSAYQIVKYLANKVKSARDQHKDSTYFSSKKYSQLIHPTDIFENNIQKLQDLRVSHIDDMGGGYPDDEMEKFLREDKSKKAKVTVKELEDAYEKLLEYLSEKLDTVQTTTLHMTAALLPASVIKDVKNQQEAITALTKANNTTEFISGLTLHGNYLKPSLVVHMINKYGDGRLKAMMRQYLVDLHDYQESTKLKDFVGLEEGRVNPDHRPLAEKLGQRWEDKTVKDWIRFREKEHRRDSLL